ncbi:MAG TPA: phage holin family protein [Deinococcales bacterium]|nr:phage holin family protein [Deinococcales bacterium]
MKRVPLLWQVLVSAAALWAVTLVYPEGLRLEGRGEGLDAAIDFLLAGGALVLANMVLRPVVLIFTLPLTIATLGLFTLVVNAIVLWVVAAFTRLALGPIGPAIVAALLVSIASWLLAGFVRRQRA